MLKIGIMKFQKVLYKMASKSHVPKLGKGEGFSLSASDRKILFATKVNVYFASKDNPGALAGNFLKLYTLYVRVFLLKCKIWNGYNLHLKNDNERNLGIFEKLKRAD